MSKKMAASFDREKAIRATLRNLLGHNKDETSGPEEMVDRIVDHAFKGISKDAFRFPEGVKITRKVEVSN